MSKTRIVATIGPASLSKEMLSALSSAGMSIARLNGSHADLDWHRNAIAMIRQVLPDVPILLDIPGRKIRTGQLQVEPSFKRGDEIVLTTEQDSGDPDKVVVNYPDLHSDLKAGNVLLADDGTLRFTVVSITGHDITIRADVDGQLRSRKGINVPFVQLKTPQVTSRDENMIAFAREHKVDFIGLSFVESSDDIRAFQKLIGGSFPRIVAKVENQGGLDNVAEIAAVADAIMVDRGDLSVETSLHDVALRQKEIIQAANVFGRPVIVATEMLHTMIDNSFPTKAEVSDITNAVLDGGAATMLSGETAVGQFPIEAVEMMHQVTRSTDEFVLARNAATTTELGESVPEVMSNVIPQLCHSLNIDKIVAITRSGFAARIISVHRPKAPILAVSDDAESARSFNLYPGTTGIVSETPFPRESGDHIPSVLQQLWKEGHLKESDLVLVVGVSYPGKGSRMNTIQVHKIGDMVVNLSWS